MFVLDTTRTVTEKIYVLTNEQGFAPGEDGDVHFDAFSIPSVQPTTEGFGCIDISYRIRVRETTGITQKKNSADFFRRFRKTEQ